jgi:hypothetical protein
MKSIFLEGLKTARDYLKYNGGVAALDKLIEEHEKGEIETATRKPKMEAR